MLRKALLMVAITAILAAPNLAVQGQTGGDVEYELIIDCPGNALTLTCPIRATDEDDMMGDPSLAVDPDIPNNLIIGSLHGTGDTGGPGIKSRAGQTFTTFTSVDHGASWFDSPYTPPSGPGSYGEHPQVEIDPFGHVYIGSLYAVERQIDNQWDYVLVAQKFPDILTIRSAQTGSSGDYNAEFLFPNYDGNRITQHWFTYNRATDNMTIVWHEETTPWSVAASQAPPAGRVQAGLRTPTLLTSQDQLRFQEAEDAANERRNDGHHLAAQGAIGVVWTNASLYGSYYYQNRDYMIQPCAGSTNPVLSDGWLYVGCIVDDGEFRFDEGVVPGQLAMFRMNPNGGEPQYLGIAPYDQELTDRGGTPKLGARSDGRLALVTASAAEGRLDLDVAYGSFDGNVRGGHIDWTSPRGYGDDVGIVDPSLNVTAANVQDLIYREYSGVIQIILKQLVETEGIGIDATVNELLPHIKKSVVAIDEEYGVLADLPLSIGDPTTRTDPTLLAAPEMVYNDLADDFLQLPPGPYTYDGQDLGDTYQRMFFAVGDYGTVIFAEVVEVTELRFAAGVAPPATPVPIASPATSLTASQVLVPAAGVSIAALMAASFALNRNKSPAAAMTKRGK